jgi:hypothetical protein
MARGQGIRKRLVDEERAAIANFAEAMAGKRKTSLGADGTRPSQPLNGDPLPKNESRFIYPLHAMGRLHARAPTAGLLVPPRSAPAGGSQGGCFNHRRGVSPAASKSLIACPNP